MSKGVEAQAVQVQSGLCSAALSPRECASRTRSDSSLSFSLAPPLSLFHLAPRSTPATMSAPAPSSSGTTGAPLAAAANGAAQPEPYFDRTEGKWMCEDANGNELEWDQGRNAWMPAVRPTCTLRLPSVRAGELTPPPPPPSSLLDPRRQHSSRTRSSSSSKPPTRSQESMKRCVLLSLPVSRS